MDTLIEIVTVLAVPVVFGIAVWIVAKIWCGVRRVAREDERGEFPEEKVCHECGYDLRSSEGRCPECGTPVPTEADRAASRGYQLDPAKLRDEWPAHPIQPRVPGNAEVPVIVHETRNSFEADLLVRQLRERGIWCKIRETEEFLLRGAVSTKVVTLHLVVPSEDEALATEIIDRFRVRPQMIDVRKQDSDSARNPLKG